MPTLHYVHADAAELRAAVRFDDLLDATDQALRDSSAGRADNGLIVMLPAERPDQGDVYVKTGTVRGRPVHIVKVSPWFAFNAEHGQPQGGFIAVLDSRTGHTLAILSDEHHLSDVRTAAVGALAARALAPDRIRAAAVLGAGIQAYWQPQALHRERPFELLTVWARRATSAEALADRLRSVLPAVDIRVSPDLERTVRDCDVLITATASREPLVRGEWLHDGQHVTALGADDPTKSELDVTVLRRARVFVDEMAANTGNGDIERAIRTGGYRAEDIAGELGDVLAGRVAGRTSPSDITVAKLVGIGAVDLAAAEVALARLAGRRAVDAG
jgi:ornithine cyclodeaminase/alanine dehydrogenase-like protein (mu-crystallin family)